MVSVPLSRKQHYFAAAALLVPLLLAGCSPSLEGTWHGTDSDRMIELRSGKAYISEGRSTSAVPYEVTGDRVVLKTPFIDTVLRRTPDGALSGIGEKLVRVDDRIAQLLGTYESSHGEYRLRLDTQGRAVYIGPGYSGLATYTVKGADIVLTQGTRHILLKRRSDGSLETPDGVLRKQG